MSKGFITLSDANAKIERAFKKAVELQDSIADIGKYLSPMGRAPSARWKNAMSDAFDAAGALKHALAEALKAS